jgi:hypothetical protein
MHLHFSQSQTPLNLSDLLHCAFERDTAKTVSTKQPSDIILHIKCMRHIVTCRGFLTNLIKTPSELYSNGHRHWSLKQNTTLDRYRKWAAMPRLCYQVNGNVTFPRLHVRCACPLRRSRLTNNYCYNAHCCIFQVLLVIISYLLSLYLQNVRLAMWIWQHRRSLCFNCSGRVYCLFRLVIITPNCKRVLCRTDAVESWYNVTPCSSFSPVSDEGRTSDTEHFPILHSYTF